MPDPAYILMNDTLVPFGEARIHVLSPAAKYGSTVFEGLRGYWNAGARTLNVFRVREHLERLMYGLKVMRFRHDYTISRFSEALVELLAANRSEDDVHIRISVYLDGAGLYNALGPVGYFCSAIPRSSGAVEDKAKTACVSSWRRIGDDSVPPRLKVAANYQNSRLGMIEANAAGYDEAIFLTGVGKVAEGAGACLAMVRDGALVTPTITSGILESVTRATLLELARDDLGLPVVEREIDRTELYACDELFLIGTGAEIEPLIAVDGLPVGGGAVGPVTRRLWGAYEPVVRGTTEARPEWRTPVCY